MSDPLEQLRSWLTPEQLAQLAKMLKELPSEPTARGPVTLNLSTADAVMLLHVLMYYLHPQSVRREREIIPDVERILRLLDEQTGKGAV